MIGSLPIGHPTLTSDQTTVISYTGITRTSRPILLVATNNSSFAILTMTHVHLLLYLARWLPQQVLLSSAPVFKTTRSTFGS